VPALHSALHSSLINWLSNEKSLFYMKHKRIFRIMRIKKEISGFIKTYVNENFAGASVYLFGSRTDENKKGGDIDILLLTNERLNFSDLSRMRTSFYKVFGEQ
jgi:predicted nucleotidyltransferase